MHHLKENKLESYFRMIQERSVACSGVAPAKGKMGKHTTTRSLTVQLVGAVFKGSSDCGC